MQQLVLQEMDSQLNPNGTAAFDIPDATMPFVYAAECSVQETCMAINETEGLMRQLYPRLAITNDELYRHMSDDDYLGRFSEPSSTTWQLLLAYDEVLAKAIPYGDQGLKKLVIPRLTEFTVADLTFTMQYPIELRVMRHGGVAAEYVQDSISPVATLSTNVVDWEMVIIDGRKVMSLYIPVQNFKVTTFTDTLNPSSLFQTSYTYTDNFYYARAYISRNQDDVWEEVRTTHSDLVYDPLNLTVVFKVLPGKLSVSIPTVYTNMAMATGDIRVDIYTTKGRLERDLAAYKIDQFKHTFNSIDDDPTYVAPLNTFGLIQSMSRQKVDGGAASIDFITLRDQVINNTLGDNQIPITNVQLESTLTRRGYDLVSNIDNITNRQFLASRRLGVPAGLDIVSGAGVAMSQLKLDMDSLAGSEHVADNDSRITIKPSMLFRFYNGMVTTVADAEIDRLVNSNAETIAREVNAGRYMYSPFHNVLDASSNNFEMRPYYLDNPTITQKVFVGENDTANLQATIDSFNIVRTDAGYRITVKLETGDQFKQLNDDQVVLQIGYQPPNESRWASVNGIYMGKEDNERVYYFDINTNYDIDSLHHLHTTNLSMFDVTQNRFYTPLNCNLDVSILVVNTITPGYQPNELDDLVQSHLLPQQYMVVTRERLQTVLGYDMTSIWRRSRTVLGDESYQHWEYDVMAFYEENEYATDSNGNVIITPLPGGGYDYEILHKKGDPVLDAQGNQVKKHQKGDVKLDKDGNPILVAPRKLLREITLLMVDGLFYFATEQAASNYRSQIPMEFVGWLQTDIDLLNRQLLEKCELFLYPTTTYGDTVVTVREGQKATIPVDQAFAITMYLTPSEYKNSAIRPSYISNGKIITNDLIVRKTVSVSDIVAKLEETSGDQVMAIEFSGLGGSANYSILTVEDDAVRLAIRKKLVVLPNQELTVEDDIQFNFLKHEVLS
ncbi:virion structural protein [Pseudomonas phage PhiPA3]|uniref:Virion structural protein n=1 Tax=Pseudomonas phage PhiPA3 TaxID=998086 RepID=F8SJW9_BPPA3|nr:virion structural protein [Pseudomonas phage PhiPA3]AEH03514.1 virion structural protein [Pseudomonas phage PhiPA3]